eukprot:gene29638-35775_t
MEAFAALQSNRKKQAKQVEEVIEAEKARKAKDIPFQEAVKRSCEFGFRPPPTLVFCAGKDKSAAVWWIYDDSVEEILGWEVHRYRKDDKKKDSNAWQHKGFHYYTNLELFQVDIKDLTNDFEYRFTVKAVNQKGAGVESPPSNASMVEAPLPQGWYRFHDKRTDRYYYASVKTNRSSWTRPETDKFFLEDEIFRNFNSKEIAHLKDLYKEDIAHHGCVTVDSFLDAMRECGEKLTKRRIKELFKAYVGKIDSLESWPEFMMVVNHLKKHRVAPFRLSHYLLSCIVSTRARLLLSPKKEKIGDWTVQFSELANRNYYLHKVTGQCMWEMPDDVRFYLPNKLRDKLCRVCGGVEEIEEIKQCFNMLDLDNSGDLSTEEVGLLLQALGMNMSASRLTPLIKALDSDGSGYIEFDEFCYLILLIKQKENKALGVGTNDDSMMSGFSSKSARGWGRRRGSILGGEAFSSLSFSSVQQAVLNVRGGGQRAEGLAPLPPTEGGIADDDASVNSLPSAPAQPNANPRMPKAGGGIWSCCMPVNKKPGYVLQVKDADGDFSSTSSPSPLRRAGSRRGSAVSPQPTPLSPSGKEYTLQQEYIPWLDEGPGVAMGTGTPGETKTKQKGGKKTGENHDKFCFCGCRVF